MSKLIPCKVCGRQIAPNVKCPGCGANNKRVSTGCSGLVIFCTLIIVLIAAIGNYNDAGGSAYQAEVIDSTDAIFMAQHFVEQRLRAPATAKFPWTDQHRVLKVEGEGEVYRVNSYVDSQNGFGAMIRSYWYCELEHIGNNKWLPLDISIGD